MVSTCPKQRRVQDEEGLASKLEIGELQSAILCTFIVPRDSAMCAAAMAAAAFSAPKSPYGSLS